MSKRKSRYTYEQWKEWHLSRVENCYENTNGVGEKTFFSILCSCARWYPEHIEEFACEFNVKKCFPPFSEEEVRHKIEDALKQAGNYHVEKHKEVKPNEKLIGFVLKRAKERMGEEAPEGFLSKRSPMDVSKVDSLTFLRSIFREGEHVFITDVMKRVDPYMLLTMEKNMEH